MYHLALDLSSRQRYLLYNNNSWSSEETFSKLSISFLGGWDQPRTVVYWPGDLTLDLDSCDVLSLFLYFRALWNPLFYVCRSSRFTPMAYGIFLEEWLGKLIMPTDHHGISFSESKDCQNACQDADFGWLSKRKLDRDLIQAWAHRWYICSHFWSPMFSVRQKLSFCISQLYKAK